jgi:hypothetical protein
MEYVDASVVSDSLAKVAKGYKDFSIQKDKLTVKLIADRVYSLQVPEGDFVLDGSGESSLCRLLGMSLNYFKKYPMSTELCEHANTLLQALPVDSLFVRMARVNKEFQVRAVLKPDYTVYDDHAVIRDLAPVVRQLPGYKGIIPSTTVISSLFRVVFEASAPRSQDADSILPVISIRNSEVGCGPFEIKCGVARVSNKNILLRPVAEAGLHRWSHKGSTENLVGTWAAKVHECAVAASGLLPLVEGSRGQRLSQGMVDTTNRLVRTKRLSTSFGKNLIQVISGFNPAQLGVTKYDFMFGISSLALEQPFEKREAMEALALEFLIEGEI